MAGVVAGAGAGFHWISLKAQRKSSGIRQDLKEGCKETDDYHLRRAPARLPSASSLAGCLLPLLAMEFLAVLVLKERAWVSKGLEGRGFGEMLEAPVICIYGTDEAIVAGDRGAIPRNLGSRETPSTERSSSRLGFMLSHI
jgi:hypothetical protein